MRFFLLVVSFFFERFFDLRASVVVKTKSKLKPKNTPCNKQTNRQKKMEENLFFITALHTMDDSSTHFSFEPSVS